MTAAASLHVPVTISGSRYEPERATRKPLSQPEMKPAQALAAWVIPELVVACLGP